MHASIQGMYYTNPDDPCYTLDNSGFEKEFRNLNDRAQILSVPQRMFGDNIHKGSVMIQSGSGDSRITLFDDGNGNLFDNSVTGSTASGSIISGSIINYVSKSTFALNFNDMYNETGKNISANSRNELNVYERGSGDRFSIKNSTRFFERSKFANVVELYNGVPNTTHKLEGTVLDFNGKTQDTVFSRTVESSQSMMVIKNAPQFRFKSGSDFSFAIRLSASADQPSSASINVNGPYNFILSKFDDAYGGQFPFSLKLCNNNANSGSTGVPGGVQVAMDNGLWNQQLRLNSVTSITQSGVTDFHNIVFVKTGSEAQLWINGHKEASGTVPEGKIDNNDDIIVGARSAWKGNYTKGNKFYKNEKKISKISNTYSRATKPEIEYFRNFKGSISNLMFFGFGLSPAEIAFAHENSGEWSNHVGNVFYNHGLITLTSTNPKYSSSAATGYKPMFNECTLSFENTHTIFEHEYSCHIKEREFTTTMNPTIIDDLDTNDVKHFVTQSSWSPYVTTVGLYDNSARLLAVGKLSRPIKKSDEYDTTFVVRFDT
jgi:hypothetical protein